MLKPSLIAKTCGKASEEQICKCGNIRVTVFTPCMIRIEADKNGRFNDLPSIAFLNRRQPPCTFSTAQKRGGSVLELTTEKVRFFISANSGKLLAVRFLDSGKTVKNFKRQSERHLPHAGPNLWSGSAERRIIKSKRCKRVERPRQHFVK